MEELRAKHKSLQNTSHHIALECINPQSAHSSPYHVHPYPSPVRLQHAFQSNSHVTGSPKMFYPKGLQRSHFGTPNDSPILGRALCLTPKGSPIPGRVSHLSDKFQDSLTLTSDTEALVTKISAMFPTVSETHIKILLKKYYNREAVVISALQVEKHPITTPGPVSMSPSASRLQKGGVYSALQLAKGLCGSVHGSAHSASLTATPHGSPSLLRPASGASSYYGTARSSEGQPARAHHSPKMKLKYLKSIFPKAEETLILDVLANKDNNVQKASEELQTMGFSKKETVVKDTPNKPKEKEVPVPPIKVVTIMKTLEEKNELRKKFQTKYNDVAEKIISIALESVDYNEERADQILAVVQQEENGPRVNNITTEEKVTLKSIPSETRKVVSAVEWRPRSPERAPAPLARAATTRRLKNWAEQLKPILKSSSVTQSAYKSPYRRPALGPDPHLRRGPKDSILLENYVTWNGPNPELRTGNTIKAEGPEARGSLGAGGGGGGGGGARGPDPALSKGPSGFAKGSIYQKLTKKTYKVKI